MISERMSFGELLKTCRIEAELTQFELAERAGVGLETISALERGINNRPRKSTVDRLCDALQLGAQERDEFQQYARPLPRSRPDTIHPQRANKDGDFAQLPSIYIAPTEGQTTIPMSTLIPPEVRDGYGYLREPAPLISIRDTDSVRSDYGDRGGSLLRGFRLRKRTGIVIILIAVSIASALLLLQVFQAQPAASRMPTIMNIVGGRSGMQLQPMLPSVNGFPCVIAGQPVTATFTVQNTDSTGTRVGLLNAIEASVRGPNPDITKLGWADPVANFPAVVQQIRLLPGETFKYEQSRTFSQPGIYFVEPTKSGDNKSFAGFTYAPRIYFRVVPAGAQMLADAGCVVP